MFTWNLAIIQRFLSQCQLSLTPWVNSWRKLLRAEDHVVCSHVQTFSVAVLDRSDNCYLKHFRLTEINYFNRKWMFYHLYLKVLVMIFLFIWDNPHDKVRPINNCLSMGRWWRKDSMNPWGGRVGTGSNYVHSTGGIRPLLPQKADAHDENDSRRKVWLQQWSVEEHHQRR